MYATSMAAASTRYSSALRYMPTSAAAHHRDRFRLDGSIGGHLIPEQLYWLFALCMLRVAHAPDDVFESIAKHQQWDWLRSKARESLAA